jgi:uncharacterized LabA/DUF88 family protein
MIIRHTTPIDLPKLNEILGKHKGRIELPAPRNLIGMRSAIRDNRLIGVGILKTIFEATMILDTDSSSREKAEAFVGLMRSAIEGSKNSHIDQIIVFSRDEEFVPILENHFSFAKIIGTPLILDI